jgi:hypothetical protein
MFIKNLHLLLLVIMPEISPGGPRRKEIFADRKTGQGSPRNGHGPKDSPKPFHGSSPDQGFIL